MVQEESRSIIERIAFTLIGDGIDTGVHNYLLNLIRAIGSYASDQITPVLFVGADVSEGEIAPFREVRAVEVVRSAVFDVNQRLKRLTRALISDVDRVAADCFRQHAIDVAFESAMYYGRRFPIPVLAWLPDFQHRHLPELFSAKAYWKREVGFRSQVAAGRLVMLSSKDARNDCERFYPSSKGRTFIVRFAVPIYPELLKLDPTQIARTHRLPEHFFYLPNQFWRHKNHRVVIEALDTLKQRGSDFVVAASGKPGDSRHPEHYEALRSLVASRGLTNNFRFLGLIPRSHVIALMRGCTALINPSLFEGWSTPVEEAKTLGVPMLLSNLRVHREQMGDSARFFEPHSVVQLSALMESQPRLPKASRQSREATALRAADARVRRFCLDFALAVEHTITSFEKS